VLAAGLAMVAIDFVRGRQSERVARARGLAAE
jgi:hypothetical protein